MKSYGLVLSGGGAKGSYEIGVWKALQELGIPIKAITGTSIGALNGAMLVQGDEDLCELAWTNFYVEEIIDVDEEQWEQEKIYKKHFNMFTILKALFTSEKMELTPLKNALEQYVDEKRIRNSPIDFGLVTFSLTDLKPVQVFKDEIPKGQLVDYLIASACFPVFKPIEINDKKYIDGGFYDNVPISLMASKGIKDIIVVDVSGFVPKSKYEDELNIIEIENTHDLGETLNISPKQAKRNIKLGYLDTMKTFQIVKGKTYYLIPNMYDNVEPDIGSISRKKIRNNLGLSKNTPKTIKRFLTYKFFRTIESHMDAEKDTNTTICSVLAEITAEIFEIDETYIYTLKDLNNKILDKFDKICSSKHYLKYIQKIEYIVEEKELKGYKTKLRKEIQNNKNLLLVYLCQKNKKKSIWNKLKRITAIIEPELIIASLYLSILLDFEEEKVDRYNLLDKAEGFI